MGRWRITSATLTAAAVPALATAGAVLSYTGDSMVTGDEESAMLRRYRATHARPAATTTPAAPPTVQLSPQSVQQIADAMSRDIDGESSRFTPLASASVLSPMRRLVQARCRATSDDEQAVSTTMAGPSVPNRW